MVRVLRLTDAFIWEDLPTTDPDTGSLTMVAWIPRIQTAVALIMYTAIFIHITQNTLRILTCGDRILLYNAWYPFDTSKSPAYELINIVQVHVVRVEHNCISTRRAEYYN
jgi:hypothetical protein